MYLLKKAGKRIVMMFCFLIAFILVSFFVFWVQDIVDNSKSNINLNIEKELNKRG